MGRAPCCDKANVKRGPWSPEEDSKLKAHIEKHGTGGNWIALPQKVGLKRCGKSCRLRWLNYLRPNLKHGGFSEEEEDVICSLYICIGSRWSIIAAQLPGRTDNDIKNYWNTKLKKKLFAKLNGQQKGGMVKVKGHVPLEADAFGEIHGTHPLYQNNITMNLNGSYAHLGSGIASELFECNTSTQGSTIPSSQPDGFHELNLQQAFCYQETPLPDHYSYSMKPITVRFGSTSSNNMNVIGDSFYKITSQLPQPTVESSPQVSYGAEPVSILMENILKKESATFHHIDNSVVLSPSSSLGGGSVDEDSESSLLHTFNAQNKNILNNEGAELSMDLNDLLYSTRDHYSSLVPLESFGWFGDTN